MVTDLRVLLRGFLKEPRFPLMVVLLLGVGIGAGTTVYSVLDQLLFAAPPHVQDAERVQRLVLHENAGGRSFKSTGLAWVDYEAVREMETVEEVGSWITVGRSLGRGAGAQTITVTNATASLFDVLGVRPALGRFYRSEEDAVGAAVVPCVAGHGFWSRELGGVGSALGRELPVGGLTCTVVGVAPAGFSGLEYQEVDLWLPLRAGVEDAMGPDPERWSTDRSHWLRVAGRLSEGASVEAAAAEATLAYRSFAPRTRDPDLTARAGWEPVVAGRRVSASVVDLTTLLTGGGALLLLLILANLANLLVAREVRRSREVAILLALGSSRGRVFRTRLLEMTVLAAAAGGVGLLATLWLGPMLRRFLTGLDPASSTISLRVIGVALAGALGTGMVVAALSTYRAGRAEPAAALRRAAAGAGSDRRSRRAVSALVALQAALSVALLLASVSFVQSFRRAVGVDLGFDLERILTVSVPLQDIGYDQTAKREFYRLARDRAEALPGVESASIGFMTPWWSNRFEELAVPGRDVLPPDPVYGRPLFDAVTPDYARTMGLDMRAGRWIAESDREGNTPVVVVNEALASLYWTPETAVGQCMHVGDPPTPCREVVGVVGNHRFTGGLESEPVAAYFLPLAQASAYSFTPRLFVRTASGDAPPTAELTTLIQGLHPALPAVRVTPLQQFFEPLVAPLRLGSVVFSGFGILALLVGTVGLFSVLFYAVAERKREFAIRTAIGASTRQVAAPVVRQGLGLVLLGIGAGVVVAGVAARWLEPLLFHARILEPQALAATVMAMLTAGLLASLLPAREAASQDPSRALRDD